MRNQNVYIFLKYDLLIPPGVEDSAVFAGVPEKEARPLPEDADFFETPLFPPLNAEGAGEKKTMRCYLVSGDAAPASWRRVPLRSVIAKAEGTADGKNAADLLRACHIMHWRKVSRFCGSCGAPNFDSAIETARVCAVCGRIEYPRICPAVITAVTNANGEILLSHNKEFPDGLYSLTAGFNEAGESLEDTVRREVYEEAGVFVKNIQYITSQSWPFPSSLMAGFKAEYAGGKIVCDGIEITDAAFFKKENLPNIPAAGSIARHIINLYISGAL
ncbi:MAG: NAD(+) diphosphatase [Spirochaetaceae bacterium]|jgi:NAD+ diphosphatase|nr:NAD(+) diphosphatase [Spirochaetaceae bacterium]